MSPVIDDFFKHVTGIAGFNLPRSFKALFEGHHSHFFDEPRPQFSLVWGEASSTWRWQKQFSNSILDDVQDATGAVLYHYDNLRRMERDIVALYENEHLKTLAAQSFFGGGNTRKLDYEYHGFVFAFRRTLDYLARGIAALLHQDFNSFRRLPDFFKSHTKHAWIIRLIEVHSRYTPQLVTFLGNRIDRSTRDRIAHYTHVPAGCLNLNRYGVFFAGGGENLDNSQPLGIVIEGYIETLSKLLGDVFQCIAEGHPKYPSS